ncbi:diguanylate cyclase domain-containing protein [Cetobacterium somerae]
MKKKFTTLFTLTVIILFIFFLFFLIGIKVQKTNKKETNFLQTLTIKDATIDFNKLSPLENSIWKKFNKIPPKNYSKLYKEIAENNRPLLINTSEQNLGAYILNELLNSNQLSPKEELYILNKLRVIDIQSGNTVNNIKLTIRYLNLAEDLNSEYDIVRAKIALSSILFNLGGGNSSIHILKNIDLSKVNPHEVPKLNVLIALNLGEIYLFLKDYNESIKYLNKVCELSESEDPEYIKNLSVVKNLFLTQNYVHLGNKKEALESLTKALDTMKSIEKLYFSDLNNLYLIASESYNLKYDFNNFSREKLEAFLTFSDKYRNIAVLKVGFKLLSQYYFETNNLLDYDKLAITYEKYLEKINTNNNTIFSLYLIESLEHEHFAEENKRLYIEIGLLITAIFLILIISYKKISMLDKKAKIDTLTNIGNRLAFNEQLFSLKNQNFSMLLFDIDNFKNINDSYGHDFGDEVLAVVGKILKTIENKEITIYRVGGEEFAIIFTNFNDTFAIESCEFIRKSIENIHWKNPVTVTISGGFSKATENTYSECDKRLYKAKNSGKNIIIYQDINEGDIK